MLYAYIKKEPSKPQFKISRRTARLISATFLILGLFLIGQVVIPIAGSYLLLLPEFTGEIASPLASNFQPVTPPLSPKEVQASQTVPVPKNYDSYRPSTWFADNNSRTISDINNLHAYTITIPSLKIKNAIVEIGGDNLKKSLIAWPTSALPGSYGVNIIFGHSELPSLASPDNYSGIFTFIMDLENGDEIDIDSDGVHYKYLVFDKEVIDPANLSVLEQRFDRAYLTLITCVPPGTVWKRGVVRAQLVQI